VSEDLILRLKGRAAIRRQIPTRKSVQEGAPDRIADLLDEAAARIVELESVAMAARQVIRWFNPEDLKHPVAKLKAAVERLADPSQ